MESSSRKKYDVPTLRAYPIQRFFNVSEVQRVKHVKCVFHADSTASLALYPDNHFHCFGCQAHGMGAIDFLIKLGGTFVEACEELEKLTGKTSN